MRARRLAELWRALSLTLPALALLREDASADWDFYPGDYSQSTVIGNSLPGTWRPFESSSPWNSAISPSAPTHPQNAAIMATVVAEAANIRFANRYVPPIWVVNSDNMPQHFAKSPNIFDTWDQADDGVSDVPVPIDLSMYAEPTEDDHIIIVDPFKLLSWEMSKYTGYADGFIHCTTFNIWDLKGSGVGETTEGERWFARGGRGSGFPIIAGLLRPEEVLSGAIEHPLVFTFELVRDHVFVSPAARTDGSFVGPAYPMHGNLFQLDPTLTDADFDGWGLGAHAKVVARALQDHGMYLGDRGGSMALQVQLLHKRPSVHRSLWDQMVPGLYDDVQKIPTSAFRVVSTGAASTGGGETTTVAPLVVPVGGPAFGHVSMSTPTQGAEIRYTTDGSDPQATSTLYAGPFKVGGATELKARAFAPPLAQSPVTRAPAVETLTLPASSASGRACLFGAVLIGAVSFLRARARSAR